MDWKRADARLAKVRELLMGQGPRLALDRLQFIVSQEDFPAEEKWRVLEYYSLCYHSLFDLRKSQEYNWASICSPQGQPLGLQRQHYSDYLFNMHYFADVSDEEMRKKHFAYNDFYDVAQVFRHERKQRKKLRIGYISGELNQSVLSNFSIQLLTGYDRSRYEVYCYNLQGNEDRLTASLKEYVACWRNFSNVSMMRQAAEQIHADGIDILFDLNGHSSGGWTLMAAGYKPAPIQVSGIGYMSTTGMKAMDYFLGDVYCDPPGLHDEDFSEQLLRLPHSHLCYTPSERAKYYRRSYEIHDPVVFGSFNSFAKITDEMLQTWLKILRQVPGSRMILKDSSRNDYAQDNIRRRAAQIGFQPGELELEKSTGDYLDRYMDIDIQLDTYPYTGGGTTCDALYRGVPIIARYGRRHGSRFCYSLLMNVGIGELAAQTEEEYIGKAVALAGDRILLQALHDKIPEMMRNSPVMDAAGYVSDVEKAYEQIWADYMAKKWPEMQDLS